MFSGQLKLASIAIKQIFSFVVSISNLNLYFDPFICLGVFEKKIFVLIIFPRMDIDIEGFYHNFGESYVIYRDRVKYRDFNDNLYYSSKS